MFYFYNLKGIIERHPHKHLSRVVTGELLPLEVESVWVIGHMKHLRHQDVWEVGCFTPEKAFKTKAKLEGEGDVYYIIIHPQFKEKYLDNKEFKLIPPAQIKRAPSSKKTFYPKRLIPLVKSKEAKKREKEKNREKISKEDNLNDEVPTPPSDNTKPKQVFDW